MRTFQYEDMTILLYCTLKASTVGASQTVIIHNEKLLLGR